MFNFFAGGADPRHLTECMNEIGQPLVEPPADADTRENSYKQIFKLKVVHLLGFFVLTYVGVEVTIGGMSCYLLGICQSRLTSTSSQVGS